MLLDASALLALLEGEPGAHIVSQAVIDGATIGAVNFSEVVARLSSDGIHETLIRSRLQGLELTIVPFGEEVAIRSGLLRPLTRHAGLSLGDRACLALAEHLDLPVVTADRIWSTIETTVDVRLIR